MVKRNRWENGSEFHFLDWKPNDIKTYQPWGQNAVYTGSGRDAIRCLIKHGFKKLKWKKLWMPTYFCQETLANILKENIPVTFYNDSPVDSLSDVIESINADNGDVVYIVNYFGLRQGEKELPSKFKKMFLIEDHTHDPWSKWAVKSKADFAIVSLRKTIPIPEGGVIWSPKGWKMPKEPPVTEKRRHAVGLKLQAMILKKLFLLGHEIEKDIYRDLSLKSERLVSSKDLSGITECTRNLINIMPIARWRIKKRKNFNFLANLMKDEEKVEMLMPESLECCPYSAIFTAKSSYSRDNIRKYLINHNIYSAILWPLEELAQHDIKILEKHKRISKLMLSIHCDMRYDKNDMQQVAREIKAAIHDS